MNGLYRLFWEHCMYDMPFRGLKSARKRTAFSVFSGKRDELAKRACCAKQVHQYLLYVSVSLKKSLSALIALSEFIFWGWTLILLLTYLWLSEAELLSPSNLTKFFVDSRTLSRAFLSQAQLVAASAELSELRSLSSQHLVKFLKSWF